MHGLQFEAHESTVHLDALRMLVTRNTFEKMIKTKCGDLNLSDSQISALVAAIDVSGDDLIQIEEFDAFLAKSGNKMTARGTSTLAATHQISTSYCFPVFHPDSSTGTRLRT